LRGPAADGALVISGDEDAVLELLGHRSIETTAAFYCGMEAAAAFERFDEIVSAYRADEDRDAAN
jgi:hypothetical protein